jgi:hypothetical protein
VKAIECFMPTPAIHAMYNLHENEASGLVMSKNCLVAVHTAPIPSPSICRQTHNAAKSKQKRGWLVGSCAHPPLSALSAKSHAGLAGPLSQFASVVGRAPVTTAVGSTPLFCPTALDWDYVLPCANRTCLVSSRLTRQTRPLLLHCYCTPP